MPQAPVFWSSAHPPDSPFNLSIAVGSVPVPSPTDPTLTVDAVQLVFKSNSSAALTMPSGTYFWRLNVDAGIQASQTLVVVEGIFEAVFYVP